MSSGWLGSVQRALHAAEESVFGLGEASSAGEGARAAGERGTGAGYSAASASAENDRVLSRLSGFLGDAPSDDVVAPVELPSELKEHLEAFLLRIDSKRAIYEKWFGGDTAMHRLFDIVRLRMQDLCKVCLRGSEARCALANQMLAPHLALQQAPQYSISYEQTASKETIYLKRLYSGWCVKISQSTFEKLAYGGDGLREKDHENLHTLIVRGPVLRTGLFPPEVRLGLVVACEDSAHVSRNHDYEEKARESQERTEQKARAMGAPATAADAPEVSVLTDAVLMELDIVFSDGDPADGPAKHIKKTMVAYTCSTMTVSECIGHAFEVVHDNLTQLEEKLERALATAEYPGKIEYWSTLKSSDATSQKLICTLFEAALGSGATAGASSRPAGFDGAKELSEQYRRNYPEMSKDDLSQKLVQWQASQNVATGFATGFGGFITMPITIPAGMIATWVTSARLAFAVAHTYGHDIFHPCTADAVLYCLTGSATAEGDQTPLETMRAKLDRCRQRKSVVVDDVVSPDAGPGLELCTVTQEDLEDESEDPSEATQDVVKYDPSSEAFQAKFETLYDLLGVEKTATQQEIRVAYRKLALRYHPDKQRSADPEQQRIATERFQILGAAYEELSDPERRKAYDRKQSKGEWSWGDFVWQTGTKRATDAWAAATRWASDASQAKHHDLSLQVGTRAVALATAEIVEVAAVGSLARFGAVAELRSSIQAGERLAASATASAGSKVIPILGALVCGAIDGATTASVGRFAVRVFKD